MSDTLALAHELIARRSITPEDQGCQEILAQRLRSLGFRIEPLPFGNVTNLWARLGEEGPLLVLAGHTDVVPPGVDTDWQSPPFKPAERDGFLYGRGAADMKGSLAAMITACERFLGKDNPLKGSIGFLITSDEEGDAINGTVKVVEELQARDEHIDWCLVGEPSSSNKVGDVIKNGRRGSLSGTLTVFGTQGHVAYPQLAKNPIHLCMPALTDLCAMEWDAGNASFPQTSFQISNINAGTGANNVIPASIEIMFNFRYSTETDHDCLMAQVNHLLDQYAFDYEIKWFHSGAPFLTAAGELVDAAREAVLEITGIQPELSTAGGTSDGRFIAPTGAQVIELGPVNATIHKINERVSITDLEQLSLMYERILEKLLG